MKRLLLLASLTLVAAIPATAAVSPRYAEWGSGPASILFTPAERAAWAAIGDDAAADLFIRLFWAKRDANPETGENEYRIDFEQRVAYADQHFGAGETKGSMSDLGKTLIALGPPTRVERPREAQQSGPPSMNDLDDDEGGGDDFIDEHSGRTPSYETWVYEKEQVPSTWKKRKFEMKFRSVQGAPLTFAKESEAMEVITAQAAAAVTRPNLTEAEILAPAGSAATIVTTADGQQAAVAAWKAEKVEDPARLEALRAAATKGGDAATLDVGVFQAGNGAWIAPVQVAVKAGSATGPEAVIVGEVADAAGATLLHFRTLQPWQQVGAHSVAQETILLPAGKYTLRIGLADAAGAVTWAKATEVSVPQESGFWVSPLVLSDSVAPLDERQDPFQPWAWQNVAVVPKPDRTFAPGSSLWYYLHVCNATPKADGTAPDLKVMVELMGPKRFKGPTKITPSRASDACWILAQGFDVTPQMFSPGSYDIKVDVTDAGSNTTRSVAGKFEVTGDPAAPPAAPAPAPPGR